jgi:adenylate kinase family enzyme
MIREDDKPETITKRYNIYKENAKFLENFYKENLVTIAAYDKMTVEKEAIAILGL